MGKHGLPAVETAYLTEKRPKHPTAHADGRVRIHRAVLYDTIGPGTHPCHWCGRPVKWNGRGIAFLIADHLDNDTWNNSPDNLKPTCRRCNSERGKNPLFLTHCGNGHEFTPENTYTRPDTGVRQCRECARVRERTRVRR